MIKKFDYLYITSSYVILGRQEDQEYDLDENRGVHLGIGNDLNGAYRIAQYHSLQHNECPIKIADRIQFTPIYVT